MSNNLGDDFDPVNKWDDEPTFQKIDWVDVIIYTMFIGAVLLVIERFI